MNETLQKENSHDLINEFIKSFNDLCLSNKLPTFTKDELSVIEQIFHLIEEEKILLPYWGPEKAIYLEKMSKRYTAQALTSNEMGPLKLFILINQAALHQEISYAIQISAYRIFESIVTSAFSLKDWRLLAALGLLRLALESLGKFNRAYGKTDAGINLIKKKIRSGKKEDWDIIAKTISEMSDGLMEILVRTQIDWINYITNGKIQHYKPQSIYQDITAKKEQFYDSVLKLDSYKTPHNSKSWGLIYKFLSDFTHPSIGSRIDALDDINFISLCDIKFKQINLTLCSKQGELTKKIEADALIYIRDIMDMTYRVIDKFTFLKEEQKKISKALVKNCFNVDPGFFKYVKKNWPTYEQCVCLGDEKFKYCCYKHGLLLH